MSITVTTQKELDAALEAGRSSIIIDSPSGVWLHISDSGSSRVEARGSSRVVAWGSSRVVAWDSSRVEARDSSRVEAWDSSRVVAWGSSSVEAWDSSSVEAWGSSSVEARDSSSVVARGSSSVVAGPYVAVHLHSTRATIEGGVVIDLTKLDLTDPQTWLDYKGVKVTDGKAILYKAVYDDWCTKRGAQWTYKPGATVVAEDYAPTRECGAGLHLCPSPSGSRAYLQDAVRYVACEVDVDTLVPLDDKCKVREVRVLHEVDLHGERVDR